MTAIGSRTRREFLAGSAAAAAAALSAPAILQGAPISASFAPSDQKLRLAIIGCGGRGGANMQEMLGEEIVALCDVNEKNLRRAAQKAPKARLYRDFRKLYDELRDGEFDGVVVSTTEHTHAFAVLPALARKKHVYCEKPLTRDIREARIITDAAKRAGAGVVTQMGTQIHAGDNYRRVVELVRAKAVGPISEVHVWVDRAWGRQTPEEAKAHNDIVTVLERPAETEPVPPELDWDLWLGPAPDRPYNGVYFPGPKWYRWWDFANGTMSDLGSHWVDLPFWALDLDAPKTVEASGPAPHPEIAPASMRAVYEYGPRGDRPGLTLTWHQGTLKPERWTRGEIPKWGSGVLFVGSKGMILSDYGRHLLLPEADFKDFERPAKTIPPSIGHHAEWIYGAKTGSPTTCKFEYSGLLTEANHLGGVAYRAGRKIEWDAKNLRIPNAPEAERFLGRDYRAGWSLI